MHAIVASPMKPGKHSQTIVFIGKLSITEHLASVMQGWSSVQASLHLPAKQASLLGQSASNLHSGTSPIGSANEEIKNIEFLLVLRKQ